MVKVERQYDARGNLVAESLPVYHGEYPTWGSARGPHTRRRAIDRVTLKTLPDGQTYKTQFGANPSSRSFRWEATIDPTGRKISATRYDAFGRVRATEQWQNDNNWADTVFTWDAADQLRIIVDPIGAEWRYGYDTLGRRITCRIPISGTTASGLTYPYDAADRLVGRRTRAAR